MQGKVMPKGSANMKINGIIEEYKVASGGNISAGDFVEYINGLATGADTQLSSETYSGHCISAVALSENKVFIAHSYSDDSHLYRNSLYNRWNNNYYRYTEIIK